MTHDTPAYGLWSLVVINTVVFVLFAFSFTHPRTTRDWRSFGAFSGFLLALFTEMYGFPLTLSLLSGWLGSRYPGLNLFSHEAGHLWHTLLGWKGDPHLDPLHILSNLIIIGGFLILSSAWRVLYEAQRTHSLATTGLYAYIRHPQYVGFYTHHARVPVAVANAADAHHVSDPGDDVRAARSARGARGARGIWQRLYTIHGKCACLLPTLGRFSAAGI